MFKMTVEKNASTTYIDYPAGVSRFNGNEAMYRKFLSRFPNDPTYIELQSAMNHQSYESAFRYAHTLKGNTGNLSLTSLYHAVQKVAEQLRNGNDISGAIADMDNLQSIYDETILAIRELQL